jgi:hypothetical protein
MYLRGDFNAVRNGDLLTASLRFAVPPYSIDLPAEGELIRVEDGEGNSCLATVVEVAPPLIRVKLDWATWKDADALELTYEYRRTPAYRGYLFRHPTETQPMSLSSSLRSSHALTSATESLRGN